MAPKAIQHRSTRGGKAPAAGKSATGSKAKEKVPSKTKGKWMPSTVGGTMLQHLVDTGYLPQPNVAIPHSPMVEMQDGCTTAETLPRPEEFERVSFLPFLLHALSYPIHPFFCGLLHFYGLQMHHLTPNSILHIACFITLCECFLSIEPHFGLWRKYFTVKLQTNMNETCE